MFIRVLLTSQVVFAGLSNLDASIQQLPGVAAYCERPVASTAKKTLENLVFFFDSLQNGQMESEKGYTGYTVYVWWF